MSNTPKTDAVEYQGKHAGLVDADFARLLERELSTMTADRDGWEKQAYNCVDDALNTDTLGQYLTHIGLCDAFNGKDCTCGLPAIRQRLKELREKP